MSCQAGHHWEQFRQNNIYHYRCRVCAVLGQELQKLPLVVRPIGCSGCNNDATHKTPPPSNSYLCEKHFLSKLTQDNPRYRRGTSKG